MTKSAVFEKAWPYGNDLLALPVPEVSSAASWYAQHFAMVEVERRSQPHPAVIMERDGLHIGFAANGGDSSQEGAAIRVNDIHAAPAELESRGLPIANWRVDVEDGRKQQVFFIRAPDGLCYYFFQPIAG